jgi:predicted transcriptional regulator
MKALDPRMIAHLSRYTEEEIDPRLAEDRAAMEAYIERNREAINRALEAPYSSLDPDGTCIRLLEDVSWILEAAEAAKARSDTRAEKPDCDILPNMNTKTTKPNSTEPGFRYTEEDLAPRDPVAEGALMDAFIERNKDTLNASIVKARAQIAAGEYFTHDQVMADLKAQALRRRNAK